MPETPSDVVRNSIGEFLDDKLNSGIGSDHRLKSLTWDGDDDGDPYAVLVVKDEAGRRFEVEFEVMVTELTSAVVAERAEFERRLKARRE